MGRKLIQPGFAPAASLDFPPLAPLSPGSISLTAGDGAYTVHEVSAPSGGSGSYTVTLYESTTQGQLGSSIATDPTYPYQRSGRTNGTTYYVTRRVSDGVSTADSEQVSVTPQVQTGASPYFTDGFEAGVLGSGGGFSWSGAGANPNGEIALIQTEDAYEGDWVMRARYTPGDSGQDQYYTLAPNAETAPRELWMEYMLRVPDNFAASTDSPHNNKLFACYAEAYSDPNNIQIVFEYWADGDNCELRVLSMTGPGTNSATGTKHTWILDSSLNGQWVRIRIHLKAESALGALDGEIELWRDNTIIYSNYGYPFWASGGNNYWRHGYLMGSANGSFGTTTDFYIDNFRIWNSDPDWSFD